MVDSEQTGESVSRPESRKSETWDYSRFRDYLLVAIHSPFYLERVADYPVQIELNAVWHEALDNMRKRTMTIGREMYGLVGLSQDYRKVLVQTVPTPADIDKVPLDVKSKIQIKAVDKFNMKEKLGDFHSHPRGETNFSLLDLYGFLHPWPPGKIFTGVVTGPLNTFVFRSRETASKAPLDSFPDEDEFIHIWNKRHETLEGINFAIAEYYKMVIYKGLPGKPLMREYP